MFQIVCIYIIIFLCGQTYINIFIVYICPDENSVYFYLSCVPSSAILRGMITCYVSAYCKTQMHILPPECLQKTFSKGLLSNCLKTLFLSGIFFSEDNSSFTVVFINCLSIRVSKVLPMTSKRKAIEFVTRIMGFSCSSS